MSDVRENLSSPFPLLVLLLVAVGLVAPRLPLQSPRPAEGDRLKSVAAPSVPSRLWQDPMAAVELGREPSGTQAHPEGNGEKSAGLESIRSDVVQALGDAGAKAGNDESLVILPVMLAATPFRDDAEERRRVRYAVVSGLLKKGFVPRDGEHIKFVTVCRPDCAEHLDRCALRSASSCNERAQIHLPYELFEEERHPKEPSSSSGSITTEMAMSRPRRVALVLWLGEADFEQDPLVTLLRLSKEVAPGDCKTKSKTAVVGPETSDLYVRLLGSLARHPGLSRPAECAVGDKAPAALADRIRFYSYGATISNDAAKHEVPSGGDAEWSSESVVRVIGGDDELVSALLTELGVRHVNAKEFIPRERGPTGNCDDRIVLLVEEDSTYSRNLGRELKSVVDARCNRSPVHVLGYFRGIDGQLPTASEDKGDRATAAQSSRKGDKTEPRDRRDEGEHAAGRSQYDYLQRLVDHVIELNTNDGTKSQVRAIGIFGNDVYDKLLILEAMRSRIRDAVYFTTDLDARFLHSDQRRWTRNLLVASHFGLELDSDSQGHAPAFRSVYQTAAYLATTLALETDDTPTTEKVAKRRGPPHLFEIGRTRAVDLTARRSDGSDSSLHPLPVREFSWPSTPHVLVIGVLGGLVVLLTARRSPRLSPPHRTESPRDRHGRIRSWLLSVLGALALVALVVGIGKYIAFESAVGRAEPFVLLQGVSAWLSLAIGFLALVVALALAAAGLVRLRRHADDIAKALGVSKTADARARCPRRASDGPNWRRGDAWRRRIDWLRGPFVDFTRTERMEVACSDDENRVSVDRLWRRYLGRTSGVGFWSWIALATALFAAFAYAVTRVDRSFFPHRGQAVAFLNDALWCANVALLWATIFWIVFEAHACAQLLSRLCATPSAWPKETLEERSRKTGVPAVLLVEALDFELIVRAADRVNLLVYIPFVQIVLLGFAFHPILGNSDVPLPLLVIALLSLAYAVYAMIVLRRAAERAKRKAVENYRAELLCLEGAHGNAEARGYAESCTEGERPHEQALTLDQLRFANREVAPAQIRGLIEKIETTRKGPFQPLLQQPFVKALLLPFGGLGSASLLEPLLDYFGI